MVTVGRACSHAVVRATLKRALRTLQTDEPHELDAAGAEQRGDKPYLREAPDAQDPRVSDTPSGLSTPARRRTRRVYGDASRVRVDGMGVIGRCVDRHDARQRPALTGRRSARA